MIKNNGYDLNNISQNDKNRYNRVVETSKRYIANAQRSIGLSDQNTARIRSRAISTANRNFDAAPENIQSMDFSQYGDRQVSRRQYMGLSNG